MHITTRLKRWIGYGLVVVLLLPLLAACMGDDDNDPTPTQADAASTATEIDATSTESDEATEQQPAEMATEDEPAGTATEEPPAETPAESAATESDDKPTPATGEPAVPGDLPIDEQISWLMDVLNAGSAPAVEDIEPRMHPTFIEAVSPDDFATQLGQMAQSGTWEFSGYLGEPVGLDGAAVLESSVGDFQVIVGLEVPEPHRFQTLLVVPYTPPSLQFESFAEIDPWLEGQAPQVTFQVAEITDGTCQPVHAVNSDEPLAVAPVFKLWVLLELADRVAAGDLSWDDELTLSDELKSLPSGTLQTEPDGSSFALSTYVAKMMTISDNTATDHLIDFLGRQMIEERMAETGNSAMDRNTPLLLTREMFYLKVVASAEERDAYIAADEAEQREILDGLETDFAQADPNAMNVPIAVGSIEWFASASDLCAVQAELYEAAQADETLRDIMAAAADQDLDDETWPYLSFKGGNEAGVAAGAWLLERADGRAFAVSVAMNGSEAGIDPQLATMLTSAVTELLAEIE